MRSGAAAPFLIFGFVAVTLVSVGIYFYVNQNSGPEEIDPILSKVEVGEFVSQVIDQGEAQSSENIEIRCEARARNGSLSVLEVCDEGSMVAGGDFLVQLDSTAFEKELEQQNISLANAETGVIQAASNLETAKATKKEYIEGTFKQEQMKIENEINKAENDIISADIDLQVALDQKKHNKTLFAKGYITQNELQRSENQIIEAKNLVSQGKLSKKLGEEKLRVLQKISFEKEKIKLDADINAATVKLDSEKKSLAVEIEKLAEIKDMIEKCTIKVPEGVTGQVVFAKESSRGGNDWILEEGTSVRQNQVLIRLPNPEKMEVKALINEQSITQIEEGMAATIKVDALNSSASLKGVVTKVSEYAESSGWMSSSIKKYAVMVKIIDPPKTLKPGMNASVTIQVKYLPEALLAPIQTVYSVQDRQFCLAKVGDKWETLEVEVGGDNSQMVYFDSGAEAGTELVLNPGGFKEYMELPEFEMETKIELPDSVVAAVEAAKKSAKARNKGEGKSGGKRAGSGKRGGAGGGSGFAMPSSGADLIKQKDTDGDGKLTKDEAGSPYSFFFDSVDTDKDTYLSESELDTSIKNMKARMQGGGGFGGGGRQ